MPGATPYVTAAMLTAMPSSVSWTVIPTLTADSDAQLAQLAQECWKATSAVDRYCCQPLRAVANTEEGTGPGQPRISVDRDTGIASVVTRRWPVTQVLAVQVSPVRCFPPQWTLVPLDQCIIRHPVILSAGPAPQTGPGGGNVIDIAPGWITRDRGTGGWRVMTSYLHAWPHTSLTADVQPAQSGPQTVTVDDVTGWAGVTGFAYDGPGTELAEVTTAAATVPVQLPGGAGTVQAGPGTLTLSSPLLFPHPAGTVLSALPPDVTRATALQAAVQALEGIDAIAAQSLSGPMSGGSGELAESVELILDEYRRII